MLTCFINPTYIPELSSPKFWHYFLLLGFLAIPFGNFVYGLIEAIIIWKNISFQSDRENKSLFFKYCIYIGSYLFLTFLLFILYFWSFWATEEPAPSLRWFTYIITLSSVMTPLIVGLLRFFQVYVTSYRLSKLCKKSVKQEELTGSLLQEVEEFGKFETKSMKKVKIIYNCS